MDKYNLSINDVKQHYNWSGKNCPAQIRANKDGISWSDFLNMVKRSSIKTSNKPKTVKIQTGGLNDKNLIKVINYFQERGWYGEATLNWKKGNPTITSGGLNDKSQKEYEAWLKKQGWYYKVIK